MEYDWNETEKNTTDRVDGDEQTTFLDSSMSIKVELVVCDNFEMFDTACISHCSKIWYEF